MSVRLETPTRPLLLDGGMGTALAARGLDPRFENSASWNIIRPQLVRDVHRSFASAGADVLLTNTFCANPWQLATSSEEIDTCNREGVVIARAERPTGVLVAGSIGATGALPPPEGDADLRHLEQWFEHQSQLLIDAGVDWLFIETLYHPKEARAAVRGARRVAGDTPIVAAMACRQIAGRYKTVTGLPWHAMLRAFVEEGADAVGANCSLTPEEMLPLVALIRERTDLPIVAKPTVAPDGGAPLYPGEFAAGVAELVAAGASFVGGCCGTTSADLAAARLALDQAPVAKESQPTRPFGCALAVEAPV